jgi:hypothetical protein
MAIWRMACANGKNHRSALGFAARIALVLSSADTDNDIDLIWW